MSIDELSKLEKEFNDLNPCFSICEELVWGGQQHPQKFELLGAWETNNLQLSSKDFKYIDRNGIKYGFKPRWNKNVSQKYQGCQKLSKEQDFINDRIPQEFPMREPEILDYIKSIHGIGPVFSIFCLHVAIPNIYPMFDEQSFKAFINITSNNGWIPLKIESDWQSYKEYQEFYIKKAEELGVENEYWRLYKALWAFGNRLSSGNLKELKKEHSSVTGISKVFHGKDYPVMLSNTLGPKAKSFKWRITPSQDLVISRVFKGDNLKKTTLAKNEVDRIERFVRIKGDWVDLANNVEKLGNGTEKEGIGSFIYKQLGRNTVEAQLSSHIGAIFVNAGIWEYRKQRGLQFKSKGGSDWFTVLKVFCSAGG